MRRHLKSLALFATCIAVFAVCRAAETGGSCRAPAVTETKTVADVPSYDVPSYSSADEDAPDPRFEAANVAWKRYQDDLVGMLTSSPDPRDWALADFGFAVLDSLQKPELKSTARAVHAAPDDPLILWMALSGYKKREDAARIDDLIGKLQLAEPDNAAVWFESLQQAGMKHDHAGVSAALKRMSATSRMDNHLADLNHLVVGAYSRKPVPDEVRGSLPAEIRASTSLIPYIYAGAVTNALVLPAFQFVVNACRVDASGRNADRVADCDAVGHLMTSNSDSLIGTMIGYSVLRVSHTFTDDDVRAGRDLDWVYEKWTQRSLDRYKNGLSPDASEYTVETAAYAEDWFATGSEFEAMRRSLQRANIATTTPDDWVSATPRFSDERIKDDAAYFNQHPIAY
jgi:hypothetical protein